jgi:hypothetical protein
MSENNYVIMTVANQGKRDSIVKELYQKLLIDGTTDLIIENDRVDRIKVYHVVGNGVKVLIRTYLVVVISTQVNLKPLEGFTGKVTFCLDDTIEELKETIRKLSRLNGKQVIRASNNANFDQLLRSLSEK